MRALGNYIIRGRLQAICVVSFLTIISLLLPAFAYLLSGVPVALVTMRQGGVIGMQVISGSLLLTLLLAYVMQITPSITLIFALAIWLPIWCCAMTLRITQLQGLMVLVSGIMGMLFIVLTHTYIGDVSAWWQEWLNIWLDEHFSVTTGNQYREILTAAVPLMNAMMASGIVISLILTVLAARWWQALLFNPGMFRIEFYALKLPRSLCYLTLIGIIALLLMDQQQSVLRDLLVVMVFLYLFQGIATVHRVVAWKKLSKGWLVSMYGLLILLPQMVLFMACIGMADSWMNRVEKLHNDTK